MAVTITSTLLGVVAAPALAQNSESAPAAAAPMKSKPKTPAGGTVMVKVTKAGPAVIPVFGFRKTGFWLEELAAPYYVFEDAGAPLSPKSPINGTR